MKKTDWRTILGRLPLPMLALAASYGVYRFALLFVPEWVAFVQAAAFETTYIGLAVTRTLDAAGRRRATAISLGAVTASIIYNTLAGWFHAQPQILVDTSPIAWLCLAVLHGAPLAWVAFLVASLLLHQQGDIDQQLANDKQLLASLTSDLTLARESETALREQLAEMGEAAASGEARARQLSERAASAEAAAANRQAENTKLRESLSQAREETAGLRELIPTRSRIVAYVREQTTEGKRSLLDVSREVDIKESTLREWLKNEPREYVVVEEG